MEIKYGRKKSGIRKELKSKLDEWVESIDDLEIKNLCRNFTIVTGGSIASMLLGEPVNDYDVYFKNKECAIKVAEYYVKKFIEIKKSKKTTYPKLEVKETEIVNILGQPEERVVIYVKSDGIAEDESGRILERGRY